MPPDSPSPTPPPGGEHDHLQRLGKYQIQKKLGAGGMGTVFLAIDTDLKRTVALKVLAQERADNPILVKRFRAEAQAAAQLTHPNIVAVYEAGEADGFLYIALEYIDGIDALELLRKRGVVPVRRSIEIIKQTCQALAHAHEKGIVHRDIKPSNLMLKLDGTVKLADMGLARSIDDTLDTNITRAGTTVGTVDYMSPEQARDSRAADIRSDIYSLGCTWYHLLTGSIPYPQGSMTNKLQAHATALIPDPRDKNPNIPEGVVAVLRRMMAKKPEDRYQTPEELITDLEQASFGRSTVTADILAGLAQEAEPIVEHETEYTETESSTSEMEARRSGVSSAVADPPPKTPRTPKPSSSRTAPPKLPPPQKPERPSARSSRRQKPNRPQLPARSLSGSDVSASSASGSGIRRTLPPRAVSEMPVEGEEPTGGLNPEHIKYVVLAILVIVILAVVYWAIRSTSDSLSMGNGAELPRDAAGSAETAPAQPQGPAVMGPDDAGHILDPQSPPELRPFESRPQPAGSPAIRPDVAWPSFPGLTHLNDTQRGEWLPLWSAQLASNESFAQLPVFVVSDQPAIGEYRDFAAAAAAIPQTGGIIEFRGSGPFPLSHRAFQNVGRVMLRGSSRSQEDRPLLVVEDTADRSQPMLSLTQGELAIEGIDLFCVASAGTNTPLIRVSEGRLLMRDCTLTINGNLSSGTAIELLGHDRRTAEGLLERTVVHSPGTTAVTLSGPKVDLLAGDTVFWTGNAPCIAVQPAPAGPTSAAGVPTRFVRLFAVTCISEVSTIALRNGSIARPAPLDLKLCRTACIHLGSSPGAWLEVLGWPLGDAGDVDQPRLLGCGLKIEGIRLAGWNPLVQCQSGGTSETIAVVDSAGWQRFWRQHVSETTFLPPRELGRTFDHDDLASRLESLNSEIGAQRMTVGGDPHLWPRPAPGLMHRVTALSEWPRPDASLDPGWVPTVTRRFDLEQGLTLNRFLNSDECPDGARVIAFGSGLKQIDWLVIEGKRIRLEFEQQGDSRLIIQPRPGNSGSDRTAWITVRHGMLDLVGGTLRLPATMGRNYPRRLLLVEDGRFAIRHCLLEGSTQGGEVPEEPLIEWRQGSDVASAASLDSLIDSSLIYSPVNSLQADLGGRSLLLRNTVLSSSRDTLTLSIPDNSQGWLWFERCMLSPTRDSMLVNLAPSAANVQIRAEETVFGPPFQEDTQPGIIRTTDEVDPSGRIVWWEDRCAYSSRMLPGVNGRGWASLRQPGHALRVAEGVQAVLLAAVLPEPRNLHPESFRLDPGCLAARWSLTGGRIGATLSRVGPSGLRLRTEQPTGTQARPDF